MKWLTVSLVAISVFNVVRDVYYHEFGNLFFAHLSALCGWVCCFCAEMKERE